MLSFLLVLFLLLLLVDFIKYRVYRKQLNKGVIGLVYKPTCIYICLVEFVYSSLSQIEKIVRK